MSRKFVIRLTDLKSSQIFMGLPLDVNVKAKYIWAWDREAPQVPAKFLTRWSGWL